MKLTDRIPHWAPWPLEWEREVDFLVEVEGEVVGVVTRFLVEVEREVVGVVTRFCSPRVDGG